MRLNALMQIVPGQIAKANHSGFSQFSDSSLKPHVLLPLQKEIGDNTQKLLYTGGKSINNLRMHLTILTFKLQCYLNVTFPLSHHR